MSMSDVINSIERDAFARAMNPPEVGMEKESLIKVDSFGKKWVYCPYCDKKHFPVNAGAKIQNLHYQCRNSKCKEMFIVNAG